MGKYLFGGVLAVCGMLAVIVFYLIFQPEIRSLGVIKPYKPTGRSNVNSNGKIETNQIAPIPLETNRYLALRDQ